MVTGSQFIRDRQKNWKPVILDYDHLLTYDENEDVQICINRREQQMLLALIDPCGWPTRYYSDTQEIDTDLVENWRDSLYLKIMENCMSCSTVYALNMMVNAVYIEQVYNRYDGTTTSVNENCPTTNFDGDGSDERRMALCMGLTAYVKSYIKTWCENAMIVLTLGAFGIFLFAVPILGWVAVVLIGGLAFVTQAYYDALTNEDAIDTVLCDWLASLEGVAINKANWGSTLAALVYDGGTDEYLIWQVLSSETGYDKQWVAFLDAIGNAWPIAEAGMQDCVCDDCTADWTREFLNGSDSAGDWVVQSGWGTYDAANDRFVGTNRVVAGVDDYWENVWRAASPDTVITRVVVDYEYQSTSVSHYAIEPASIAKVTPAPVLTLARASGWSNETKSGTLDTGDICMAISSLQVRSTSIHPNGVMTGYTRITRIAISGTGVDPYL